jgi:hypothetical protein
MPSFIPSKKSCERKMLLEQLIFLLKQSRINDYGLHGLIFKRVHWFRWQNFLKGLKQTLFVPALGRKWTFVILVFPGYEGYLPSRMTYFGSIYHKKKKIGILRNSTSKWRRNSRWLPDTNVPYFSQFLSKSFETLDLKTDLHTKLTELWKIHA